MTNEPTGQAVDNPYQPPDSVITAPKSAADPLLPSRWRRLGAALIDMAIGLVCAIPFMLYQVRVQGIPWGDPVPFEQDVLGYLYSAVAFLVVNGVTLVKNGQTIGKLALGIKIATIYYTKPNLFTLTVIRTYLFWLLSYHPVLALLALLDVLFIFGKNKRCVHDHVARTVVVDRTVAYNPG